MWRLHISNFFQKIYMFYIWGPSTLKVTQSSIFVNYIFLRQIKTNLFHCQEPYKVPKQIEGSYLGCPWWNHKTQEGYEA